MIVICWLFCLFFPVMFGTKSERKSGSTKSTETPGSGPDELTEVVQTTLDPDAPIIIAFLENKVV